jgi:hypothetical protein
MSRAMVRWTVAGALALAAAWGGVESREARAAPNSTSSRYVGDWPNTGTTTTWDIAIRSSGAVSGSYKQTSSVWLTPQYGGGGPVRVRFTDSGTMTGTLVGGALSISGTQIREASSKDAPQYNYTYTSDFARTAAVVPDADGNLRGTSDTGETFVWWRQ